VIVARDEDESERLDKVRGPLNTILKTCDFKGPTTVVRGELDSGEILIKAASLCAHYSNCPRDKKVRVWFKDLSDGRQGVLWVLPRGHKVQGIFRI
jgi:predicted ribosome quality control (RQC) complex YloA/Tae2 family protein